MFPIPFLPAIWAFSRANPMLILAAGLALALGVQSYRLKDSQMEIATYKAAQARAFAVELERQSAAREAILIEDAANGLKIHKTEGERLNEILASPAEADGAVAPVLADSIRRLYAKAKPSDRPE